MADWLESLPVWVFPFAVAMAGLFGALVPNFFQVSKRRAERLKLIGDTYHMLLADLNTEYDRLKQQRDVSAHLPQLPPKPGSQESSPSLS